MTMRRRSTSSTYSSISRVYVPASFVITPTLMALQHDVEELVFLSDDIRRARRHRIRDMAYERERAKEKDVLRIEDRSRYDDERIFEREVIYDSGPRRSRRY